MSDFVVAGIVNFRFSGGREGIIFYIRFPGVGVVNIRFPGLVSSKTNSLGWVSSTSDSFIRVGVVNIIFPGVRVVNISFFHNGGCHQHQCCKQQIPHNGFGQNEIPWVWVSLTYPCRHGCHQRQIPKSESHQHQNPRTGCRQHQIPRGDRHQHQISRGDVVNISDWF